MAVARSPLLPTVPSPEIDRELAARLALRPDRVTVLTGVRRAGKSTLQAQLMRQARGPSFYCNLEDTRLFGFGPDDFATFLGILDEVAPGQPVFLDEVQEVDEWQRLVRALLDRGRLLCVTGSNASLLGREVGSRLTGRHASFEVFPFSYAEYCAFTRSHPGASSLMRYLDDGGFPAFLRERQDHVLQELVRDIVYRDVAARHGLRDLRHVLTLLLFLLANTGQPFSFQRLTKTLAVPSVAQTSRYLSCLEDAYLLVLVPRFSSSFRQRAIAPPKYYAVDTGLCRANAPQGTPDLGRRLENAVALHLRRRWAATRGQARGGPPLSHAGERDRWECDFVTPEEAIQVCLELTPMNRARELRGAIEGARLPGKRRPRIVTLDQSDRLREDGMEIEIVPAWRWMSEAA